MASPSGEDARAKKTACYQSIMGGWPDGVLTVSIYTKPDSIDNKIHLAKGLDDKEARSKVLNARWAADVCFDLP